MPNPADEITLLTAPGVSAIAGIRLRGTGARRFVGTHFTRALVSGSAIYGRFVDGAAELDDPLILWDDATQTADVFCHGGRWVVKSIVDLAIREGFELVDAGLPLLELAVDTDNELERDVLRYLPMARTREAIVTLLGQRQAWQELNWENAQALREALADRSLHWLLDPPLIAIIGVPNAGKSTLANRLFGQDRSIVADLPGTTRDYVEEYTNLGGLPVLLVDTPGLRKSDDHLEMLAIGVSEAQIESADLRILLIDPTQDRRPQEELARKYPEALVVTGKADVAGPVSGLAISAATAVGLDALERETRRRFGCEVLPHRRCCAWTERQRELIRSAIRRLTAP